MWTKILIDKPKPNTMVEVLVLDKVLLVANINNELFCADNYCPHEGIKLTLGCFKGKQLKCSLHGFSFALDNAGQSDEIEVDNLQTYPIKEELGKVFIKI